MPIAAFVCLPAEKTMQLTSRRANYGGNVFVCVGRSVRASVRPAGRGSSVSAAKSIGIWKLHAFEFVWVLYNWNMASKAREEEQAASGSSQSRGWLELYSQATYYIYVLGQQLSQAINAIVWARLRSAAVSLAALKISSGNVCWTSLNLLANSNILCCASFALTA